MGIQAAIEPVAFDETDAFAAALEDAADLRFTMLRLERPFWSLRKVFLPDSTHIQIGSEGSGSIVEGATAEEGLVVFLQTPGATAKANGVCWAPGSAFLMPAGAEFCLTNTTPHDWLALFVPNERLPLMDRAGILDGPGPAAARMLRCEDNAADELWSVTQRFIACAAREPGVTREKASCAAFSETITSCIERLCPRSQRPSVSGGGRPSVIDSRLIASAVEVIEDLLPVTASMQDLVAATGVSERALRRGFSKFYGVSPTKYMRLRRLHLARRLLCNRQGNPVKVTEVAARLGWWDFGRFADSYRKVFGEYPSETLRREGRRP